MAKDRYLKLAIDHGTTNSAVAAMEPSGPRVIKPDGVEFTMPSAVYINRTGRMFVGKPALDAMMLNPLEEGEGHTGYKLRIGQDQRYAFSAAGKYMTGPELGSFVLRTLLQAYQDEFQDEAKACVITVPAVFNQAATEGTREAASKAGLLYYPLLQEPVAAALAYGFDAGSKDDMWIVFDLGGGTLDISLVMVRDGSPIVPPDANAGDDNLGGRKLDRELFDWVLGELRKTYDLKDFSNKNPKYRTAWNKLLLAVEAAKIELSTKDTATVAVAGVLCKDAAGKEVRVEIPVARKTYEQLIGPDINRAVDICEDLLRKQRLSRQDIGRLILVGGPTQTPYVRQVLRDRLNIPLDYSINPMTAVALGAAMYAVTQEIPREVLVQIPDMASAPGEFSISVEAARSSKLPKAPVFGTVKGPEGALEGMTVELTRSDGGWSSGRVPVDEDGEFEVDALLIAGERPRLSQFTTKAFAADGTQVAAVSEPGIWHPYPEAEVNQPNSLLVELEGGVTEELVKGGASLPCREEGRFKTTKVVRKGSDKDVLQIPVREAVTSIFGDVDLSAECNLLVGELHIAGDDERITRDIPEGSEVDVTISVDKSRAIRVRAYIPLLEDEFEAEFTKSSFGVDLEQIEARLNRAKGDLAEIRALQDKRPLEEIAKGLAFIDARNEVENIEKDLERGKGGESEAEDRALKRTLRLAAGIRKLQKLQRVPRIEERIAGLEKIVKNEEAGDLESIKNQFNSARESGSEVEFSAVEEALDKLDFEVRVRPLGQLFIDVAAVHHAAEKNMLDESNLNDKSLQVFKDAMDLWEKMEKKGKENLTDEDVRKLQRMHERLEETFFNLGKFRQSLMESLAPGQKPSSAELRKGKLGKL